jgi:hypothetical protein
MHSTTPGQSTSQIHIDSIRRLLMPAVVVLLATTVMVVIAAGGDDPQGEQGGRRMYAIGLWGDMPYSDGQALMGVPNLIADMNSQHLAFTAHDGDIKAGNGTVGSTTPTTCTDALYEQALQFFNLLEAPAIYTPGDNDWTDCDRASNGGFSSRERLDHERAVFFGDSFSLGQRQIQQDVQAAPLCLGANGLVPCVENRRWTFGRVTYATLNIQGSCNNLCDTAPDPDEYAMRNAANIAWMTATFQDAIARESAAIMFITQANPGWDATDGTRGVVRNPRTLAETDGFPDGFQQFLLALRQQVIAFGKPVAYVHGDTHYARVDKPFLDASGRRLENFTRVETFGDSPANGNNDVHWMKVLVDTHSREVFAYQPQVVPANRTAVPAQ